MKKVIIPAAVVLFALSASPAFAQEANGSGITDNAWYAIAAAFSMAIAALGGALGMGRTMEAALGSIGRNPGASGKITTPMIIGLALIESLVIYALVVAIILSGNIG